MSNEPPALNESSAPRGPGTNQTLAQDGVASLAGERTTDSALTEASEFLLRSTSFGVIALAGDGRVTEARGGLFSRLDIAFPADGRLPDCLGFLAGYESVFDPSEDAQDLRYDNLIGVHPQHGNLYMTAHVTKRPSPATGVVILLEDAGDEVMLRGVVSDYAQDLDCLNQKLAKTAEEIRRSKEVAEAASLAKSRFLAMMSHEIRTPMNGVLGMLQLLDDTALTAEQQTFVRTARASTEALLQIISDILDFSKIEAERLELETTPFNLRDMVEDAVSIVAPKAQSKSLDFGVLFDSKVPEIVVGDPGRLRQILLNLVGNAIKFTHEGEIRVEVTTAGGETERPLIRFEVADTGIGIAPEARERLFEEFRQADVSTTREYGGTGLGLAICRRLLNMMGGSIFVESEIGRGSRFVFTAPLSIRDSAPEPPLESVLETWSALVVSASQLSRSALSQLLERLGGRVDAVESGGRALEMMTQGRLSTPTVVLIADRLPDGTGLDIGARLRNHPVCVGVPQILLHPMTRSGDARWACELGFAATLAEPASRRAVATCLRPWIGGGVSVAGSFEGEGASARLGSLTEPAASQTGNALPERAVLHGARLLLVDDSETNRQVAEIMLRRAGCAVEIAANGQEAVDAVSGGDYDLILMDMLMPVMDGVTAALAIRALGPGKGGMPILALTAGAVSSQSRQDGGGVFDGVISKPIIKEVLLSTIAAHLTGRSQATERKDRKSSETVIAAALGGGDDFDLETCDLEAFDADVLRRFGDAIGAEAFPVLIGAYLSQIEGALAALPGAMAEERWEEAERYAHDIKSSAASLGCAGLRTLAYAVEVACERKSATAAARASLLPQVVSNAVTSVNCFLAEERR